MTPPRAPVMPTSVMYAVPPGSTRASAVGTCVCVPTTAVTLAVEVPAERDLLARRLRVHVDEHVLGVGDLAQRLVDRREGGAAGRMKRLPDEVDDPERGPVALDDAVPRPGWVRQVVRRADDVAALVQVGPDLAVAIGVVAERDDVGARAEQLLRQLGRDPDPAGDVLAVDHDEVERELLAQPAAAARAAPAGRPSRRRRRRTGSRSSVRGSGRDLAAAETYLAHAGERDRAGLRARAARGAAGAAGRGRRGHAAGSAVEPVVVPRWVQLVTLPLAIVGPGRSAAGGRADRPGVHDRRADRDAAQPVRHAAAPAGRAARTAAVITWLGVLLVIVGIAVLLANPIADQVSTFRDSVPGLVDDANALARQAAGVAQPQRRQGADPGAGAVGAPDHRRQPRQGVGRGRLLHARRAHRGGRGIDRLDPGAGALDLHAALRRADRRRGEARRPEGRRHAGGRLPDPRPGRGVRLRARAIPVLADHGRERGDRPLGPGQPRHLSRRQDVCAVLRRLLRLRRADPVRRAGDRRAPAGHWSRFPTSRSTPSGWPSSLRRCSRSRGTSWRRTFSRRPFASILCW